MSGWLDTRVNRGETAGRDAMGVCTGQDYVVLYGCEGFPQNWVLYAQFWAPNQNH